MSSFTVEELVKRAFDGISYKLPDAIKQALKKLESCLEITDAPESNAHHHHHHPRSDNSRRGGHSENDASGFRTAHNRPGFGQDSDRGGDNRQSKRNGGGGGKSVTGKSKKDEFAKNDKDSSNVDDNWALMRAFKPTKIETKTGIEKTVNDIRVTLNKMSANNYEKQKDVVLGYVVAYFQSDEVTDADTRRISTILFEIASTNKFYSEMYASLYKELVGANSVFRDLLDEFIVGFTNTSSFPVYVDPDTDYDGFCAYSKACDKRKSTSTFFVNCLKLGLIPVSKLADILRENVDLISAQIREEGRSKITEELIENVFILATLCKTELANESDLWNNTILPNIKQIVAERNAGHPSLSNRAAFKCMDMLDNLR